MSTTAEPRQPDPKYRVTMRSVSLSAAGATVEHEAVDYVPASILDAYVDDARGKWQSVVVSDGPDHGPGGVDGETHYPAHLVGDGS